ncbi:hypothetical protein CMV_025882 [Castanea mollissima]|uniref:Uncharacterized protein n=1 Tax=Castanea mollissima TaxID=60419 RepID=A0A8J4V859_9ROSI|nr:hypothetical protein CMV_025882 [Castanea mollissima]
MTPFVIPCLVQSSRNRDIITPCLSLSPSKLLWPDLDHLSVSATVVLLVKPFSDLTQYCSLYFFAPRLAAAEPQRTTTATSDSGGLWQWHMVCDCVIFSTP